LAVETTSPAFLAIHPNHGYLYAVNEVSKYDGQKTGSVSAFSIDRSTGKLTALNTVSSGGPGPCHLTVDHTGKYLLVANYGVGSVAMFPILANGGLAKATVILPHKGHSIDPKRQ
jgi:6-phosphogluconolactonase